MNRESECYRKFVPMVHLNKLSINIDSLFVLNMIKLLSVTTTPGIYQQHNLGSISYNT